MRMKSCWRITTSAFAWVIAATLMLWPASPGKGSDATALDTERAVPLGSTTGACSEGTVLADFPLAVGQEQFWDGEYVDTSDESPQGCESYEYRVVASDGGARLRVALDPALDYRGDGSIHPDGSTGRAFRIELYDEFGRELIAKSSDLAYSVEVFLCFEREDEGDPCEAFESNDVTWSSNGKSLTRSSAGAWRIKVIPEESSGWLFRMRAKLEPEPVKADPNVLELPNLRPIPPFELTFKEPAVSFGFFVGGTPIDGNGCTPDEEVTGAMRCLRFSTGPENVGEGAFEVRGSAATGVTTNGEYVAYQRLYYPHNSSAVFPQEPAAHEDREAGTLMFHAFHDHWHYDSFVKYELFRVTRQHPTKPWKRFKLSEATPGTKVGFCPSDERLADWNRFYQDRIRRWADDRTEENPLTSGLTCLSLTSPIMGLSVGWGDLYEWARIEQYVEFPTNAEGSLQAGFYLLRSTIDPENLLLESDETDNTSYALFEVYADEFSQAKIRVLKRGYGSQP